MELLEALGVMQPAYALLADKRMSAIGRKPSYWPHCPGGLKADFAPGHLSEGILRDSRLGLHPKNVGKIEEVFVSEFYDRHLDLRETLHRARVLLRLSLHPYFQHATIVPPMACKRQIPKARRPRVANMLSFERLECRCFCDIQDR